MKPTDGDIDFISYQRCRGTIRLVCDSAAEAHLLYQCFRDVSRAVLDRWGCPPPVPLLERQPEPEDLHPIEGWAWFCTPKGDWVSRLPPVGDPSRPGYYFPYTHWLPYWAIPHITKGTLPN